MSVVTEIKKTKQKWSLNPRGKAWSEDSNKFGQKMLEKMGWSRGKGLGAKENGVLEHVRVSFKNDTKGMGFKEGDGQWTEHDSNFNALLQSLSGQTETENDIKLSSLEKKSQSSKVRVHYKKFTRGKDLSRCTEKDLANIFGKKSLKPTPTAQEDDKEEDKELSNDSFTHNGGSMVDYFKKKLPNYGKIGSPAVGSNGVLSKDSESEGEACVGFGFKTPEKKKRKSNGDIAEMTPKKLKCEEEDHVGLSNPAFDPLFGHVEVQKHVLNTIEEEEGEEIEKHSKKSKRTSDLCEDDSITQHILKIKKKTKNEENLEEPLSEDQMIDCKKKKKNIEESDLNGEEVKKKKKKKDQCENNAEEPPQDACNGFEIKRKKKKQKNKENLPTAEDNPNFEDVDNEQFEVKRKKKKDKDAVSEKSQNFDEGCQNSSLNENFEVKRKKTKKEDNAMALVNPVFDSESVQDGYVSENFEVKRKKKNKKDMSIDNPNFDDENCEERCFNNNFEVKRKKKKKKKKDDNDMAIDNPTFNDSIDNSIYQSEDCSTVIDSEPKMKKKRKKEDEDLTVDNSIVESEMDKKIDNDLNETDLDLILNVTSTPTLPEIKSMMNNPRQSSIKRRKSVRFSDVNEERIIPSNEDRENKNELFDINTKVIMNGLKDSNGTSNLAFNKTQIILEENLDEMSKKFDAFQAEVENDMNEAKDRFVGEVGDPDGENEKLPDGATKLKFKYARFDKSPHWLGRNSVSKAKRSYKHLIKGDIVLGFNNTNLHEIKGYSNGAHMY